MHIRASLVVAIAIGNVLSILAFRNDLSTGCSAVKNNRQFVIGTSLVEKKIANSSGHEPPAKGRVVHSTHYSWNSSFFAPYWKISAKNIEESIRHCIVSRLGSKVKFTDTDKLKAPTFYLHSGTAVHLYGCRKELNDLDIWSPRGVPFEKKNVLGDDGHLTHIKWYYATATWLNGKGLTDKGTAENEIQIYCPRVRDDPNRMEVDLWKDAPEHPDFPKLNERLIKFALDLPRAQNMHLKVMDPCLLIELKCMLLKKETGLRKKLKESDIADMECLCEKVGQRCGYCAKGACSITIPL